MKVGTQEAAPDRLGEKKTSGISVEIMDGDTYGGRAGKQIHVIWPRPEPRPGHLWGF